MQVTRVMGIGATPGVALKVLGRAYRVVHTWSTARPVDPARMSLRL